MALVSWRKFKWFGGFDDQRRQVLANCTGVESVVFDGMDDYYFERPCKSVQVGTKGIVKLIMYDGSIATVTTVINDEFIDRGIFLGIKNQGTTAINLTGWLQGV